jgi:mRNA-degrading endonuclease RelE of RelBE toxin-antitoxin system
MSRSVSFYPSFKKQTKKLRKAALAEFVKHYHIIIDKPEIGTSLLGDLLGYFKYEFGKNPSYRIIYTFTDTEIEFCWYSTRENLYEDFKKYLDSK